MFTLCPETITILTCLWFSVIVNSVYGYTSALRAHRLPKDEPIQHMGPVLLHGVCVLCRVFRLEPSASQKTVMSLGAVGSRAGEPWLFTSCSHCTRRRSSYRPAARLKSFCLFF